MIHNKPSIYLNTIEFSIYKNYFFQSDRIQVLLPDYKQEVLNINPQAKVVVIPNAVTEFKYTKAKNKLYKSKVILSWRLEGCQKRKITYN